MIDCVNYKNYLKYSQTKNNTLVERHLRRNSIPVPWQFQLIFGFKMRNDVKIAMKYKNKK